MRITFLGSGSAFVLDKENYQSNILIESDKEKALFDAGTTIASALDMQGFTPDDIDKVFISHLHGDHSGGLEYLGFKTFFSTFPFGEKKIEVFSTESILTDLWNKQLSASMDTLNEKSSLETFFKVSPIKFSMKDNFSGYDNFNIGNLNIIPVKTFHCKMDSFGIYIKEKDVFISGDTKFTPNKFKDIFQQAKVIFHDCEFKEYENSVHAQFHQLKTLPNDIKAKMYLYHYMLEGKSFQELEKEVLDAGFRGLVQRGFSIEF
jgi:ribonuclease BN (tRNA processing enzyme)